MKPKERAKFASRGAGCGRPLSGEDIDALREFIAEQIVAAIEEEREAIAKEADDKAEEFEALAERWVGADGQGIISRQYAADASTARWLARKIRARSSLIT